MFCKIALRLQIKVSHIKLLLYTHVFTSVKGHIFKIILFLDTSVIHVHVCMTFVRIIGR